MATTGFDIDMLSKSDPAMVSVGPSMELAKALSAAGMDTSAAHPMQALARMAQAGAGTYLQGQATSDLAKLYASQGNAMADALEKSAPGHPYVAALRSSNPMVQAMALKQAGPAMMKLPEEAEDKRRFGITSGMTREGLDLRRELADRPEFKSDLGIDPRTGYKRQGWVNPKMQQITYESAGGMAPGAAMPAPVVISSPSELFNWKGTGKPAPFGTRFIKKDDPDQKPHIWEGG